MHWPQELLIGIVIGVLTSTVLGIGRFAWNRRRVPALGRVVRRDSCLTAVLGESRQHRVTGLDVMAPRLTPARRNSLIQQIQDSWAAIADRGSARIVTLDSEESLRTGAELQAGGSQVRIARRDLVAEALRYHVFTVENKVHSAAIVYCFLGNTDRPKRITPALVPVLRNHFEGVWQASSPLETVLAEKIIKSAGDSPDRRDVLRTMRETTDRLNLQPPCVQRLLPHLAFRHGCSVVLVVGPPGAGQSHVRQRLDDKLAALSVRTRSITDYVYAYHDFVHQMLGLRPSTPVGFRPHAGGGFIAPDETALAPALRRLAQTVHHSLNQGQVTLVEFARANLVAALQEFDHLRPHAAVIYVSAPPELRAERLARRAEPPESVVDDTSITLRLSDNHVLPSAAAHTLHGADDLSDLRASREWRQRIFHIENNFDDGNDHVDSVLDTFLQDVTKPYCHV